ncbi:glycolate oxidase [Phaeodactylum tricornutum CCAP 1055/1]|jgi:L-lactate dehydrogenase (cytochrome)|uniref:Glycolate oxidase n=3 Tax=Phaeodactylum tricornutum TaxID=2850 RepID=B7FUG8_PHATC|nr:glycolate oxidase [Phaeodactylum tricornutum CCAP 1055/1]EEC50256.1 glycolate oxidase [Phaeodactylum tricornutum CCAP 1055/1]|eukprot:XP_002178591.1 glycolate oxidase [Phaeodactylum tricornutum CCAP 1055/1]
MIFNPHKLGLHKILKHIPLNAIFDAPYKRKLARAVNIADLRLIAKSRAHKMVFDYLDAGADDEISLRRGKDAYSEFEMHYKVLAGIKPPLDLSTKIFGQDVTLPFFGCPTAGNRMFHWEGETAAAKAAEHHGTMYGLSSLATTGITEIGELFNGPKVFQLYVWKDRELVKDVLAKAKEGGFNALALTVDFTWYGNRERDIRNDFSIPPKYNITQTIEAIRKPAWTYDFLSHEPYTYACINTDVPADSLAAFVNSQLSPEFSWSDAEWLLGEWNGPAAPKGVVRPEDAKKAIEIGFSSIWVSNHGARQLETSPATIDVLPSIRAAVGPDVEIIMDGGVQRGTDICKALALGADAVGVGKPYLWGLAAGGTAGVIKAYDILKVELDRAMGLLGTPTVAALKKEGPSLIKRRPGSARDYPDMYAYERGYGGGVV